MDRFGPFSRPAALCLLTALLAGAACGGDAEPAIGNRLWVDHLPADRRDPIAALIVGEADESGRTFGAFFQGTAFRGRFDLFEWIPGDDGERATIKLLQDGREARVKIHRCEPDPKLDFCVELRGDPHGVTRYQSRRRWGARGRHADPAGIVASVLADDPELAPAFADPP